MKKKKKKLKIKKKKQEKGFIGFLTLNLREGILILSDGHHYSWIDGKR